jgi:hypothetical protein
VFTGADASPAELTWQKEWWLMQQDRGHYMVSNLIAWLEATERRLQTLIQSQNE